MLSFMDTNPYQAPQLASPITQARPREEGRPVGVAIAAIWGGLFAGVLPLGVELFILFAQPRVREIMGPVSLGLSICLAIGVVATAVGTFVGNSNLRYAFVVLVAIHYSLLAYNNVTMLYSGAAVSGGSARFVGRIVRSIVTPVAIAGYLTLSSRARAFFRAARRAASA
jgi:hypothetical protein